MLIIFIFIILKVETTHQVHYCMFSNQELTSGASKSAAIAKVRMLCLFALTAEHS